MKKVIIVILLLLSVDSFAQWVKTAGPYGGNVANIVVSGQRIFACLQSAGIFYSDDNCRHWNKLDTIFDPYPPFEQETPVCKAFPGILIAGSGFNAPMISYNNGKTFVKTVDKTNFMCAAHFIMLKDRIYTFGATGLFSIQLNDTIWKRETTQYDDNKNIVGYNIAKIDTTIIITCGKGVLINQAFKTDWENIEPYHDHSISADIIDCGSTFLIYTPGEGFTKYSLSGKPCEFKPTGLEGVSLLGFASNNNLLFAYSYDNKIYRSDNQGLDWVLAGVTPAGTTISSLAFKSDTAILGTLGNGIFISKDLNKWESMSEGLRGVQISLCSFDDGVIGIGGNNFLCVNYNNSDQWQTISLPDRMYANGGEIYDGEFLESQYYFDKKLYIGTNIGLHVTGDMGKTWETLSDTFCTYEIYANKKTITLAETLKGIFQSHDQGKTWKCINPDMIQLDFSNIICAILVTDKSILLATNGGLRYSFNDGKTWIYPESKFLRENIIYMGNIDKSIFIAARELDFGITEKTDAVYVSIDDGHTWSNCTKQIPKLTIDGMVCNSKYLFVMSGKLLYYSKDKGKSWKSKMINIPEKSLDCIGVSERKIFITTRNGVWTSKIENIIEM